MINAKVSFTYPTLLNSKDHQNFSSGEPILDFYVKTFPSSFGLIAVSGLSGIDVKKSYSIDSNVYFNEELRTDPHISPEMIDHRTNISHDGFYVATYGVPIDKIDADTEGVYVLRVSIFENLKDGERILLDQKECQFGVFNSWEI